MSFKSNTATLADRRRRGISAANLPQSSTWSRIFVRGHSAGDPQTFNILSVGSYCALCESCKHWSLVTPNTNRALICTHCQEPLHMPLDAHFTCPAALKRQFAVMEAFDIEGFLASQAYTLRGDKNRDDELVAVVGFMDVSVEELPCCRVCQKTYPMSFVPSEKHICQCGARNSVVFHGSDDDMHGSSNGCVSGPCGFWSSLAQAFSAFGGGSSSASKKSHGSEGNCKKQRVLAVVAGSSLIFYHADARDNAKHRVMCRVELEDACFAFKDSERTGIVGSSVGVTVEIDLGLADVAKMWLSILVNRVDAIERQKRSRIERAIATADTDNVSAIRLVPI